jgi:uracil phosphoribosyltransferase
MLKIQVNGIEGTKRSLDADLRSEVKRLADELYKEIVKTTPVHTGRARSGWRKQVQNKNFTIENAVPYIGVLDQGRSFRDGQMRGSKQAPKGIIGPSLDKIKGKN